MRCPYCNYTPVSKGKKWKYSFFEVESFFCENCKIKFRAYFRNGKLSHTIPSAAKTRARAIAMYLKKHETASLEELARELNIRIDSVLYVLLKMEKEGIVERTEILRV